MNRPPYLHVVSRPPTPLGEIVPHMVELLVNAVAKTLADDADRALLVALAQWQAAKGVTPDANPGAAHFRNGPPRA